MSKIDFIGFQYGTVHSSDLNILRVSNGTRYEESLTPTLTDQTAQITGGDGTLYWNSFYTQRTINVSFVFDSLTEVQLRQLRQTFTGKEVKPLIFDEQPYKKYMAKVQKSIDLKYICFGATGGTRIYKGEGSITFICYNPYARLNGAKYLSGWSADTWANLNEWKDASGLLASQTVSGVTYDYIYTTNEDNDSHMNLYNPGDVSTDVTVKFPFPEGSTTLALTYLKLQKDATDIALLKFSTITKQGTDTAILINSRAHTIEGLDQYNNPTGNLYNKYISEGDFFQIPVINSTTNLYTLNSIGAAMDAVDYTYLYF